MDTGILVLLIVGLLLLVAKIWLDKSAVREREADSRDEENESEDNQ